MGKLRYLGKKLHWCWQNGVGRWRIQSEIDRTKPITDLTRYERRIRSQNGEDGILEAIFTAIGTTDRFFAELGSSHGLRCNCAYLARRLGWNGLMIDGRQPREFVERRRRRGTPDLVRCEFISAENVEAVFEKHSVPREFDLLSIDIDGNDYWVWKSITSYRPRVVVIEYNATIPPDESRVIAYDPGFVWDRTTYVGASLLALKRLGESKGYTLVGCNSSGVNAFFVESALAARHFAPADTVALYRPSARAASRGCLPDNPNREWVRV